MADTIIELVKNYKKGKEERALSEKVDAKKFEEALKDTDLWAVQINVKVVKPDATEIYESGYYLGFFGDSLKAATNANAVWYRVPDSHGFPHEVHTNSSVVKIKGSQVYAKSIDKIDNNISSNWRYKDENKWIICAAMYAAYAKSTFKKSLKTIE